MYQPKINVNRLNKRLDKTAKPYNPTGAVIIITAMLAALAVCGFYQNAWPKTANVCAADIMLPAPELVEGK